MADTKISRAEEFKSKGEAILKGHLKSMEDFLKESTASEKNAKVHPYTNTHLHKSSRSSKNELGRLHLQIRQDLIDRLIDEVFRRKRDPNVKSRNATQRAIIEEALERYFDDL